jgi:DnaA-like protein
VSRQAIAAALARRDLAGGERLVAFSLASYAGHDGRAWPGAPAAAARAGLSRSRYLHDRDQLVRRGLVVIEDAASGRGRASTVALPFAAEGPWWEGEINAELFEAVLSRTRRRGPARLLLAAMAALADSDGVVRGVSNEEMCAAAGVADRTYRRARPELLASGELVLLSGAVGRGNTNVWQVPASAETPASGAAGRSPRRVAPAGARPLAVTVAPPDSVVGAEEAERAHLDDRASRAARSGKRPVLTDISVRNGGQNRTVPGENCPLWSGVSPPNGGQDRTLLELPAPENPAENPAQNPAENPAANARAGREPQNPRIEDPPNPPLRGGSRPRSMIVEQVYTTERGRRRRRQVRIDLDEVRRRLGMPNAVDRRDWQQIRELLEEAVGESTFAIWLEPAELIAVDDERRLVIAVPAATASWTRDRFGWLLTSCAERVGRGLRFASEPEVHALGTAERRVQQPRQEVAG